jgi:hypothetical protein
MRTRMFFTLLIVALLVLAVCRVQAWGDQANVKQVNCNTGQTITQALEVSEHKPITIQVRGICNENVIIWEDDVTLVAHPSGGGITGVEPFDATIVIMGSRALIDGLTVTGGGAGIRVLGDYNTIRNCTVQDVSWNGIVFTGGKGTVDNCTILSSGFNGINIGKQGGATVTNSKILDSGNYGIRIIGGSATVGNCTIQGSEYNGIYTESSNVTVTNSTVSQITAWASCWVRGSACWDH